MYEWHDGRNMGPWGWVFMAIMMIAFWGGVVTLAVWALRRPHESEHQPQTPQHGPALRILSERFARGEIDVDEYHHRRDVIDPPR